MIDKLITILIRHKLDDIETIEAAKQIVAMVIESNIHSRPKELEHGVLHSVMKLDEKTPKPKFDCAEWRDRALACKGQCMECRWIQRIYEDYLKSKKSSAS